MANEDEKPHGGRVALALQGGGAHGAFAWGVLDRLMERGQRIDAICGVSSGALTGVMLAQGLARGGPAAARAEMRRLWQRVANAHAFSPLQAAPLERWLWGDTDLSNGMMWQGMEMAMRLFSPAQINPFGHNPVRLLVDDLLQPHLLASPAAPRLTVAATDVMTGQAVFFGNADISVEVLCATACLPLVFPAVEIDGRAYWDGAYAGNPPLAPLLSPPPEELILVRAQVGRRPSVPITPAEVTDRLNEIACQNVLAAELAALPPTIRLRSYDADEALMHLPISSKFNGEQAFLAELFEAGRAAA
ncbi:MAG TPA: patatin-like phospholipase family protein [Rhodopila sp.]|uniref:patatin-like phospholipase family protein n=1 Tax=Rhodopila sp. TaxID=2480087 RepID=UPI002CFB9960|nr:patatin-like phospholipase family protein [Rhodopila sp.]HVY15454.1 patatin-like phospholipase family protein [Rhodopila sp.]